MRSSLSLAAALPLLLGLPDSARPAEEQAPAAYHVSPAGSDANDGTAPGQAWKSLERANRAALRPGDRLLLEGGQSFSGNLLVTASGTAEAPITIASYGTGAATILAGDSCAIRLQNCGHIAVRGLVLRGSGVKPDGATSNTSQGLDIVSTAVEGKPWENIRVDRLTVSGFRDGIVLRTPIGTQEVVGYRDVRIANCTISECLVGGFYCWGSRRASGKPWRFPLGAGTFTDCRLTDCVIHDIYGDPRGNPVTCLPIQIFNATAFAVERCVIRNCGQAAKDNGQPGGVGGLVFLECDRSVARFNECHHVVTAQRFDGCAFDIDGGCTNCVLEGNYSHDNEGSGFQTGTFEGSGPVAGNVIRFNISENDTKKNPGNSGGIMTWGRQERGLIHNNTVVAGPGLDGKPAAFLGNGKGLTVCNNIFVATHDGEIVRTGDGCILRNNCYFRADGGFAVRQGKVFDSLAAWQDATGQEKLDGARIGFAADPRLRRPGGGGAIDNPARLGALASYDLLPSSPLIGKGLDIRKVFGIEPGPGDFRGTSLRNALDLGALQHR